LGRLADSFSGFHLAYQYFDAHSTPSEISEGPTGHPEFHALVILGGSESANDSTPALRREYRILENALAREIPVLGICLGAQMIARALGAAVKRNPAPEIGWHPVDFLAPARTDPLLKGLVRETLFHWHAETFDIPSGAVPLAQSQACPNQAFRYGERVWGLQFHPEVTPGMIGEWIEQDAACGSPELAHPVSFHPAPDAVVERAARVAAGIFAAWCDIVNEREIDS
jgi:GMP synthase-like glutamine amidotransferase